MKLTYIPLRAAPDTAILNDEFGGEIGITSTQRAAEIVRRVNTFEAMEAELQGAYKALQVALTYAAIDSEDFTLLSERAASIHDTLTSLE